MKYYVVTSEKSKRAPQERHRFTLTPHHPFMRVNLRDFLFPVGTGVSSARVGSPVGTGVSSARVDV